MSDFKSYDVDRKREAELLRELFDTIHFDKEPAGLPKLDPEDDDED